MQIWEEEEDDIWSPGLSPDVLGAVSEGNWTVYAGMLEASGRSGWWRNMYKDKGGGGGGEMIKT